MTKKRIITPWPYSVTRIKSYLYRLRWLEKPKNKANIFQFKKNIINDNNSKRSVSVWRFIGLYDVDDFVYPFNNRTYFFFVLLTNNQSFPENERCTQQSFPCGSLIHTKPFLPEIKNISIYSRETNIFVFITVKISAWFSCNYRKNISIMTAVSGRVHD